MRIKIELTILILCTLGAFVLGWWPEHRARVALDQQLEQVRGRLADSEADARISRLQVRLLSLLDLIHANNYTAAQSAASAFFDAVRAEQTRAGGPPELGKILAQRDSVTVALSRSDSTVEDALRAMRGLLAQIQPGPPLDSTATTPSQN